MESFSITKAKARVLTKALSGCVMISGGFSGTEDKECIRLPQFDRRQHIEPLVAVGLLVPGEYANQYQLSEQGRVALSELPKSMRWQSSAQ